MKLNQEIIRIEPDNVDALARLARAYFELGNMTASKKQYEAIIEKDPYNQIAAKFLKRIDTQRKCSKGRKDLHTNSRNNCQMLGGISLTYDLFIEEPGKTKIVSLLKVAEPQKLSLLSPGLPVNLVKKNRGISVTDQSGEYLGVLPDDLAHHLLRLIGGGNKYHALIKTIKLNALSILIREIFRSSRFRNQPSFLDNIDQTLTYSSANIILAEARDEDVMTPDGEEEEPI